MADRGSERRPSSRPRTASASGRTVEIAVARALGKLDFAPGELTEDQYEVTVSTQPEEGFLGVGGADAVVEVRLLVDGAEDGGRDRPEASHGDAGGAGESAAWSGHEADEDDIEADDPESVFDHRPRTADDEDDIPAAGSARLREFLTVVLAGLGVKATVKLVEEVDVLRADVAGEDLGVFIGRRGQTIDAVEYLASLALYPHPESRKRVEIDAEGYKQRRRDTLERVAIRKAQEAARRGRPVELEAMTSAERKIVHLVLKDRRDVVTESRGREPNRAVVILPTR